MTIKILLMLISSFVLGVGSTIIVNNTFVNSTDINVIAEAAVCEQPIAPKETFNRTRPEPTKYGTGQGY